MIPVFPVAGSWFYFLLLDFRSDPSEVYFQLIRKQNKKTQRQAKDKNSTSQFFHDTFT